MRSIDMYRRKQSDEGEGEFNETTFRDWKKA